jgi:radical SAM superfamily enzyme YgiQ (UPF0313 family)
MAQDPELLELMARSGCLGVLIGFESLDSETLESMNKRFNARIDRAAAVRTIHRHGLSIYATFVFGYDQDTPESLEATYAFARENKLILTAFNHLVPFPGTPLYARLEREGRLLSKAWWLDHDFHFGDIAFKPRNFTPRELSDLCFEYRRKFYSLPSIASRFFNFGTNFRTLRSPFVFLFANLLTGRDSVKRQGLPMGFGEPF